MGDMITGGLNAAQQAGVAVLALVLLIVLAGIVAAGLRWWFLDRRQGREQRAREHAAEMAARERALALQDKQHTAEMEARERERTMYVDAAKTAGDINNLLMDRLERLTATHTEMAKNVASQTEGIDTLMGAINKSETDRAERYQKIFDQRDADHQAVEGVTAALKEVERELSGLKSGVDTLAEIIRGTQELSDEDRRRVQAMTDKVDTFLRRLEETDNAQQTT